MEKASDFDLIHNHYDFLPLSYSKLINTPMLTTIHGFSSQKIIPVYKKYNDSSYYVSISNSDRSPELNYLATVYNGIKTEDFKYSEVHENYLLFFGRIHPDKGTLQAIEIAKASRKRLIIAGIVQDQEYFKQQIEPHLNENITFYGHAGPEDRNKLLGKAIALLHPINFNEPFGLSVAEAMYCGTPVIAFERGSMAEVIRNKHSGYLVRNVDEAAEAVHNISTIRRINCHKWAKDNFSSEKMVSDYISLYKKIIQGR
jgi:glycosyltransferase involved in cell wall biosynthesis